MKKIWVLNYKASDLQSVENISSCLRSLYLSLSDNFNVEVLELEDDKTFRYKLEECLIASPDHVAVIHPSVNFHPFYLSLLALTAKPQFLIHVFGNFTRNAELWVKQEHLLKEKKVQFLSASESYKKILSAFISPDNLSLIPFPVNVRSFEAPEKHKGIRLLYTGRYHEQKNVTAMIEALDTASSKLNIPVELTLMITFDDFNPTTFQLKKIQGEQFQKWMQVKKNCSHVTFKLLNHASFEKMGEEFSKHDGYVSFSTFFDEDYGCAVMEALCAGLPCLVTRWGGYGDFANEFPSHCLALDIFSDGKQLTLETSGLDEKLKMISSFSEEERKRLSEKAQSFVSQKKLGGLLQNVMKSEKTFSSFKSAFKEKMKVEFYEAFWKFGEKK